MLLKSFSLLILLLLIPSLAYSVTLTWTDKSAIEDGFTIEKKDPTDTNYVFLNRVGPNIITYIDKTPPPGRCYRVKAFNLVGLSPPSNEACIPTGVPDGPIGLMLKGE